jgi:hypothetical protein
LIQTADAIVLGIRFETLCLQKATTFNSIKVQFSPITEVGISNLDLRDLHNPEFKGHSLTPPGDRAMNWRKKVNTQHYIVDEYHDHHNGNGVDTPAWNHHSEPYKFAFGKSKFVKEVDLPALLETR